MLHFSHFTINKTNQYRNTGVASGTEGLMLKYLSLKNLV